MNNLKKKIIICTSSIVLILIILAVTIILGTSKNLRDENTRNTQVQAQSEEEDTTEIVAQKDKSDKEQASTEPAATEKITEVSTTEKITTENRTSQQPTTAQQPTTTKPQVSQQPTTILSEVSSIATDAEMLPQATANINKYKAYIDEVIRLTNEIRASVGVAPVTYDETLSKAASIRAIEIEYSGIVKHTRPNGTSCFTVLDIFNYKSSATAENIAGGQSSPKEVINAWKNSQSHYATIINPAYTKIGVGYSSTGNGEYIYYWVQIFSN